MLDLATSVADGQGYTGCNSLYFVTCQQGAPSAARPPLPVLFYAAYRAVSQHLHLQFLVYIHILLNVLTGILLYAIAEKLFHDGRVSLIVAALWATYLPMARFVGYYQSEILLAFLLTLTVYLLMRAVEKPTYWRFMLMGLGFGLTLITRAVFLYAIALLPVGLYFALGRDLRRTLSRLGIILIGVSVFLLPWIVRNYQVFDAFVPGSTLNGYNLLRHNHILLEDNYLRYVRAEETRSYIENLLSKRSDLRGDENEAELDRIFTAEALRIISQHPIRYLHLVLHRFLAFQWLDLDIAKTYGYVNTDLYRYSVFISLFTLLSVSIGLVKLPRRRWRTAWVPLAAFAYLALIYPFVVTMFRYIAGALLYPLMFSIYGLVAVLFPGGRKSAVWRRGLAGAGVLVWGVWIAGFLSQSAMVQQFAAVDANVAYYEGALRLVGYDLDQDYYRPGDVVHLSLYFKIPTYLAQPVGVSIHLLNTDFESIANTNVRLQTDAWGSGQVVRQMISLRLPDDLTTPVSDYIQLAVYAFTDGYPTQTINTELSNSDIRLLTPDTLILTEVSIMAPESGVLLSQSADYQIGDTFSLSSYDLPDIAAGPVLEVSFQWTVEATPTLNATQFVHLINPSNNQLVVGFDSMPFDGRFPTTAWIVGTHLVDHWQLALPDDLRPGDYQVSTGFYDPLSNERLPVTQDGKPVPNNLIDLGTIRVGPS